MAKTLSSESKAEQVFRVCQMARDGDRDMSDADCAALDAVTVDRAALLAALKTARDRLTAWEQTDDLCAIDVVVDVLEVVNAAIAKAERPT
jgi:hypothetical protein